MCMHHHAADLELCLALIAGVTHHECSGVSSMLAAYHGRAEAAVKLLLPQVRVWAGGSNELSCSGCVEGMQVWMQVLCVPQSQVAI